MTKLDKCMESVKEKGFCTEKDIIGALEEGSTPEELSFLLGIAASDVMLAETRRSKHEK